MPQPTLELLIGGPDTIERAASQTITLGVGDPTTGEPAQVTVAGSSFSLYDRSGTALVTAGAVACPTAGRVTYALLAADVPATLPFGDGYREEWVLVIAGTTYRLTRDACLCRRVPVPAVSSQDLYDLHHELQDAWPPGQSGVGWRPQIDAAWVEIQQRLWDQGRRPWLVWSGGSLRQAHLYLTLAIIFRSNTTSPDSRWELFAADYQQRFQIEWDRLRWDEIDEETGIKDPFQQSASPVQQFGAGPRHTTRFGRRGILPGVM